MQVRDRDLMCMAGGTNDQSGERRDQKSRIILPAVEEQQNKSRRFSVNPAFTPTASGRAGMQTKQERSSTSKGYWLLVRDCDYAHRLMKLGSGLERRTVDVVSYQGCRDIDLRLGHIMITAIGKICMYWRVWHTGRIFQLKAPCIPPPNSGVQCVMLGNPST